jgi:signal transduction histidine kinase
LRHEGITRSARRIILGDWTPTVLTLACGVAISLSGFAITKQYYRNVEEREFAAETARQADALNEGIKRYTDAVNAVATFVTASDRIDRWEFLRFADLTLARYSGFSALAWVPRVSQLERPAFEAAIQRDGLFGLTIREAGADGALTPAGDRLEYLPIAYLVPFEGNEQALSYDLGTEPRYRNALESAGDLGQLQATKLLPLPTVRQAGPALWLILPLYMRNSAPADILERRKSLAGFAIGVLRLDDFVADVLGAGRTPNIYLSLFDVTDGSRHLLFGANSASEESAAATRAAGALSIIREFEVAGRRWSLMAAVNGERGWNSGDVLPYVLALVGALLTGLLAQHQINMVVRRRTVERVVRQRTAELSDRNEALRSEVAQRQRTEVELRGAKEKADSANRAKSEFLAMVSHELRTPLNAIIGFSAMLAGQVQIKLSPESSQGYATDIHRSGTHLLSLINDILDLSKAEVGKVEMNESVVDLHDVVLSSVGMVHGRADEAGVKLEFDVPADVPLLRADDRKLNQVLLNLMSNAIKFTPADGTVAVRVSAEKDGDVVIRVSDTGIGIAKHELERVFEPFVQLDSRLARKYEGTGLGLPLSRRWIEFHGGTLVLDSDLGIGTVAEIRLPRERVHSTATTAHSPKPGPGKQSTQVA